jgi:hypothetical protein
MREGIVVDVSRADRSRLEAVAADRNSPQKHLWTPPALQAAPSSIRLSWSAAAIYPACCRGPGAAGRDEIRGSVHHHVCELTAPASARVPPIPVRPVTPSRRRSPSQLVECRSRWWAPAQAGPTATRSGSGRHTVGLATPEHRPDDPGELVGQRGDNGVERPPREQAVDPAPQLALAPLGEPDDRSGAVH